MSIELKVKKHHPNAKLPSKAYMHDAGLDVYSCETKKVFPKQMSEIDIGISIELPPGYYITFEGRSGLRKEGILLPTAVIDSGFRGRLSILLYSVSEYTRTIYIGDKVGQMLIHKTPGVQVIEVDELTKSKRGEKGFGSSGR